MKEVQMTFRIEPDLRARFTEAAGSEHRPAAQVLRELMRAYVSQGEARAAGASATGTAAVAERLRREDAVNFARASVGLEGFALSAQDEADARRLINGDLALARFVKVKVARQPAAGKLASARR